MRKPWITSEIKELIKEKNKLFSKFTKRPITYGNLYKSCRNRLNNLLKLKKKSYFQSKLLSCNNDSKKTWSILNEVMNRKSTKLKINEIMDGTELVEGAKNVADTLNSHFVNTPVNITNSLVNNPDLDFRTFFTGDYPDSFVINYLSPDAVADIVLKFLQSIHVICSRCKIDILNALHISGFH